MPLDRQRTLVAALPWGEGNGARWGCGGQGSQLELVVLTYSLASAAVPPQTLYK